ncbi:MAG: malto-oligosyltrehalose synthase [Desulfobacterales bacterium]
MKIPVATYRLQFQPAFGFKEAAAIVPYLSALGISHVYASPIFTARKGSLHGYDVVDPSSLNPALGTPEDWKELTRRLEAHGMEWVQDIVPNHMAFDSDNRMLADVLENGPHSPFHDHFDIEWDHPLEDLRGKVMAPFLGGRYSECLANGEILLSFGERGFEVAYGSLAFPLRIESYLDVLGPSAASVRSELGEDDPDRELWIGVIDDLQGLEPDVDRAAWQRRAGAAKEALWRLYRSNPTVRRCISRVLERHNPEPGGTDRFEALDRLLSKQRFRLCCWRAAIDEINYRRFFHINELIAVRQDHAKVFDDTHGLLARLAAESILAGVRVDHIDGIADPGGYLHRLRRLLGDHAYILVEKILAPEEPLHAGWPVQGTTGYDFSHWLNGLFVYRDHEAHFSRIYADFSGRTGAFDAELRRGKEAALSASLNADLDNLVRRIQTLSARMPFADHLTRRRLKAAIAETLVRMPVYRTYILPGAVREVDRNIVDAVISQSIIERPGLSGELERIRDLLLGNPPFTQDRKSPEPHEETRRAVQAFQQLSAALTAKGVEDTAFYRYHRLASLNEVGAEPGHFGCSSAGFHSFIAERAKRWPHTLNGTATHDTKRGEDVRARLNVLSELPEEWEKRIGEWRSAAGSFLKETDPGPVPDPNTEYLLYQTLIGAWPPDGIVDEEFAGRIKDYMVKAAREAGEHTSWADPVETYETALTAFVDRVVDPSPRNAFLPRFAPFCRKIAFFGLFNSLSQCLLKITAPGVPDFYQGTELPQYTLVDPDNRRLVSYDERRRLLDAIGGDAPDPLPVLAELLEKRDDGAIKLYVTARALDTRRRFRDLFRSGDYVPLETRGRRRRNLVAFARSWRGQWCVAAVPRFVTSLVSEGRDPLGSGVWDDTAIVLPPNSPELWRDIFSHQRIEVKMQGKSVLTAAEVMAHFPAAMLVGEASS